MNYFTTSLMKSLFTNDNNLPAFEQAVSELFRSELEKSLNEILAYELTAFLDYEPYQRTDSQNSRNGFYERKLDTKYGPLTLRIPRDRLGEFFTSLIPKYRRRDFSTEATILDLFEEGMSNSEICTIIRKLCGHHYSKQTISNITDKTLECIDSFKNRTLNKEYPVIYLDGTSMALRRDTVSREMVHIALGITLEGTKEILGYKIAPNESSEIWKELLEDLRSRGVERVSLFCTDGLSGMENVISESFPASNIQRCLVHIQRNLCAKTRVSDRKEVANDFKEVYRSKTKEDASSAFDQFIEKWKHKYPSMVKSLSNNENLFTFYDYPECIRQTIYSTNLIEGNNKQLKRSFKKKEQFPTEQSEEKYLVIQFNRYNEKNKNHIHRGFGQTIREDWFKD